MVEPQLPRLRALLLAISESGIPCVTIDRSIEGISTASVVFDDYLGGRIAAEYLLSLGHKRFAMVCCSNFVENEPRVNGFTDLLIEKGLLDLATFKASSTPAELFELHRTEDIAALRDQFGVSVVPFVFPIVEGDKTVGLVDVLAKTAKKTDGSKMDIPADAQDKIEEYSALINEQIAETDEAIMETVLMEEPLTADELKKGLHDAIAQRSLTPVFCGSALAGYGTT